MTNTATTRNEVIDAQRAHLKALQEQKAAIDTKTAPLIEKREQLWAQIHPLKGEIDRITEEVKTIQGGLEYHKLAQEIGKVAKDLGGRALSDSVKV